LMPDMDGFEVLHQLRADKRALHVAVLVVTSKDLLPDEKARLKRKMASLVSKKEASLDYFARIVGRVLGNGRASIGTGDVRCQHLDYYTAPSNQTDRGWCPIG